MAKSEKSEKTKEPSTEVDVSRAPGVWSPFGNLRSEIDRLFDDFGRGWPSLGGKALSGEPFRGWRTQMDVKLPVVDVVERGDAYVVTAEMPGITEDDIDVSLHDDVLTVKGEKKQEREEKKENYRLSERSFGSFQRSFRLPDDADAEKIAAHCKDGVLEVSIPKSAKAREKVRKIEIGKK